MADGLCGLVMKRKNTETMKPKMTNAQIDRAMESGSAGAAEYFTECGKWMKANLENLVELHKDFESETVSEMDRCAFCFRMFNETSIGREAADRFLRPILSKSRP